MHFSINASKDWIARAEDGSRIADSNWEYVGANALKTSVTNILKSV